jgi:thiaminase (transcriptional activator TenA)
MEFINELDQHVENIYQSIIQHPFNIELAKGILPEEKFRFYISQDMHYIGEYSRALAALASVAPTHGELLDFISFAKEGLEIERTLHEDFSKTFNIPYPKTIALATEAYANFLLSSVAFKSYPEALAGLLPCFWLYNKVATDIYQKAYPENKYQKWIETYAGAAFDQTTHRLKEITERLARENNSTIRQKMKVQYIRSSRYEWLFWDSAYHMRYWING